MARKLRIQYPGAIDHVMNRGGHQELIFSDDDDRSLSVSTMAEGCQRTGWQIHSFSKCRAGRVAEARPTAGGLRLEPLSSLSVGQRTEAGVAAG
jgi:hypothetical protein